MPITLDHHKHIKIPMARPSRQLGLDMDVIDRIAAIGLIRRFSKKEVVFTAGSPSDRVYYVARGALSLLAPTAPDQQRFIICHVHPGEFVGASAMFGPAFHRRPHTLVADDTTDLIEVTAADLSAAFTGDLAPDASRIMAALAAQTASRFESAARKMSCMAASAVRERILQALQDLCREPSAMTHPLGMQVRISRQDLARLCGCSREMAGRALRLLESDGVLTAKGKTVVLNAEKIDPVPR